MKLPPSRKHRLSSALASLFAALVLFLFAGSALAQLPVIRFVRDPDPAPGFRLKEFSGNELTLEASRGKVIFLNFWATWCGPCQRPMAELQKLKQRHPDWGDRVAIVPLSIDDTLEAVRQHVNQRGWTNTFNVWAGDGGWRSAPARAFHVSGVPTTYIIDAQGKIVVAGHPAAMNIDNQVDAALKKE